MQVFIGAVKAKLETLHISQSEFARRASMDQSSCSKLLRGQLGNCTLSTCDEIAAALGTTTVDLLMPAK